MIHFVVHDEGDSAGVVVVEGVTAGDHIKQIQAMGETLYPYLKARWEQPAQGTNAARAAPSPAR